MSPGGYFACRAAAYVPRLGGIPAPASGDTVPDVEAITTEEVERIRDSFIAAAKSAQLAGFDGFSVHGAFGWILSEFMSPHLNNRTDKYGGSLENRARFTIEVIEGIRRACFLKAALRSLVLKYPVMTC